MADDHVDASIHDRTTGITVECNLTDMQKEMSDVVRKMIRATKDGGYMYTSFTYGEFHGYRNERYFTDFTSEGFAKFMIQ